MPTTLDVFISSKMAEVKDERDALHDFLPTLDYGDIKLRAWQFDALDGAPATSRSIREVYLKALQNSALYLGIFWNEYGEWTIDEFDRATEWGIERHVYVKNVDADKRDLKVKAFLDKWGNVQSGITIKWFKTIDELREGVKKSIEAWITDRLQTRPGGISALRVQDPDDIPEKPRKLIGRDDLLREIPGLLDDGERVLLQGFGGTGKTALAATAAVNFLRAEENREVLWLKAGSAAADALFDALVRSFDAKNEVSRVQGDAKIQAVRAHLRKSGAKLLVLDDCWNGQALFTVLKAVPSDMPVLVTARQRYSLDKIRDVGELSAPDTLRLLNYYADSDYSADPDAAALCAALSNHPFSIEIAGKTLKVRKWKPGELLKQIQDAPHDLKTPANFNEKERTSVKELLDTSVNALDEEQRKVFFAFGAFFAPQVTADMLSQFLSSSIIWGGDLEFPSIVGSGNSLASTSRILQTLQDFSLIERVFAAEDVLSYYRVDAQGLTSLSETEGKKIIEVYRIHDLAYSYVRAQATDKQRKKALDVCLAYTFFYNEPAPELFAMLRPELDNLLGAAAWALATEHYRYVERFTDNLWYHSKFLDHQGLYLQGARLQEQAFVAAQKRGDVESGVTHLANLGVVYMKSGRYEEAVKIFKDTLAHARATKQLHLEELMLLNLSSIYYRFDYLKDAYAMMMEALPIARQIGDRAGEAMLLDNLGNVALGVKKYQDAYDFYKQALAINEELGAYSAVAVNLFHLGSLFYEEGELQNAADLYLQARGFAHKVGDVPTEARALHGIGLCGLNGHNYEVAVQAFDLACSLSQSMDDQAMLDSCLQLAAKARARLNGESGETGNPVSEV